MEAIWWLVLLAMTSLFAFHLGLKVGGSQLVEVFGKRAKRRMTVEEYQTFRLTLASLLIPEEGD